MTSDAVASVDGLDLADRLRSSELPAPDECRAIRERAGATQEEIAHEIGVTRSAVHRWEHGARSIRRHHAINYRRVLDRLRQYADSNAA